jgi:hypothetical protein
VVIRTKGNGDFSKMKQDISTLFKICQFRKG